MTASYKIVFLVLATSAFAGCIVAKAPVVAAKEYKAPDLKVPKFKLDPKTQAIWDMLSTCDKKDSELSLDQFDPNETVVVTDKIASMDNVNVDCDGKTTSAGHGPIRNLNQFIEVAAPADLKEAVNFVHISNARTCSDQLVDAKEDDQLDGTTIEVAGQDPIKLPAPVETVVGVSGKLKILLNDSKMKISPLYLNVHDKNNVLKISYYGKCLKYKAVQNKNLGEAYNCEQAELLGQIQMVVSVQVERNEVAGTYEHNVCTKK
jgi:hypothetical protein